MRLRVDRRIVTLLRIGLGVLFIVAALPKLQDPVGFAKAVENYRMVPESAERAVAVVLPAVELIVGVLLVVGVVDAGASLIVFALMIFFTAAVGTALVRGLDITCGCFDTAGGSKAGLGKIAENLALTAAAFVVYRGNRSWLSVRGWLRSHGDIE